MEEQAQSLIDKTSKYSLWLASKEAWVNVENLSRLFVFWAIH